MDIRFAQPELQDLDRLRVDALALSFFSDERPLRGVGGLVDWRLCGCLSRHIMAGFVTGEDGEQVLVPVGGRLAADRVLLFGLGREAAISIEYGAERIQAMLHAGSRSGARTLGIVLPGRSTRIVDGETAMESLVRVFGRTPEVDELVILESPEGQRQMAPVLERERRRARARAYG